MNSTSMPIHVAPRGAGRNPTLPRRKSAARKSLHCLLLLGFLAAAPGLNANPFYVAPSGSDSNNGSKEAPFRTIGRAQTAARAATVNQSGDVVVYLREGRYQPEDTIRFTEADSGRNGHRVIYRSHPGEEVRISGGRAVTGWTHFRDGIYRAPSPVPAFRQIYVNGTRGIRARTPNHDSHRLTRWNDNKTIRIPEHQISNWSNLNEIEMVISKHWHQSRLRIESFNTSGGFADVVPRDPERTVEWRVQWPNREPNQPYYFENSLDFLDQPGEWFLDRGQQQLYYMPRPGESIQNVEVIVPKLERLLEVTGASHLSFIGLTFEHTNWSLPDNDGFIPIQGNLYIDIGKGGIWLPSGVHLESTSQVRFERNVFRRMGGGAIDLAFGTHQTQLIGNAIADIAASGITVYSNVNDRNPPTHQKSRGDVVRNNYITRVGQDYPGGVAIIGTFTDGLVVEHNEIFNNPYTGISIGWGWTSNDTALRNNIVRYNRIHQVMNLLDDGAGIYTLSKQPGGIYEENYISDLVRNPLAGSYQITALYLDEQTEGITMRNNVVRNLSGVELYKENRVQSHLNNVYNNGSNISNASAIIAKAGLQEEYRDIADLVSNRPISEPGAFWGVPAPLPGRIQVEDFDHGGPGVAYHDTTALNQGGEYRPTEQVDIEICLDEGGGYNIGYTAPGEWLEYTLDVKSGGTYNLLLRLASINSGRYFHITGDGRDITGRIDVPNTGGWQNWQTVTVENVTLQPGEQKLRIHLDTGDFNLNWFEAVAVDVQEPPTVALASPLPGAKFQADEPIAIEAEATDPDGGPLKVEFFANDIKIGERTVAPYSLIWETPAGGDHALVARATNQSGITAASAPVKVTVAPKREPFSGSPAPIPGRILMAEYDKGGPGVAYHDTTDFNQGGAFRLDEHVDVEVALDTEADYNVGWMAAGEWINYTVDVAEAGVYDLKFRLASESSEGRFHLEFDGRNVTGNLTAPNTGTWQNWTTVTLPNVTLPAGVQTMRLCLNGGEFNISYVEFELVESVTTFDQWQQLHFSLQEQEDPAISGPLADPNGTGVPNLLNYAFNQTPSQNDRRKLPVAGKVTVGDQAYLTITYTRLAEADDLTYLVETSSDLVDWTTDPAQVLEVSAVRSGSVETVTVRDKQPIGASDKRFLRLRVSRT